jgi:hypothetical protein
VSSEWTPARHSHWAFTELLPLVGATMRKLASSKTAMSSPRTALRPENFDVTEPAPERINDRRCKSTVSDELHHFDPPIEEPTMSNANDPPASKIEVCLPI